MDQQEMIAIRRAAFLEAIDLIKSSNTSHNNSTGHYKGGWNDAKRDIARMVERHIEADSDRIATTAAAA